MCLRITFYKESARIVTSKGVLGRSRPQGPHSRKPHWGTQGRCKKLFVILLLLRTRTCFTLICFFVSKSVELLISLRWFLIAQSLSCEPGLSKQRWGRSNIPGRETILATNRFTVRKGLTIHVENIDNLFRDCWVPMRWCCTLVIGTCTQKHTHEERLSLFDLLYCLNRNMA